MTEEIRKKVLAGYTVDTRKYRYISRADYANQETHIKRIERKYLGTVSALSEKSEYNPNGWEIIQIIK